MRSNLSILCVLPLFFSTPVSAQANPDEEDLPGYSARPTIYRPGPTCLKLKENGWAWIGFEWEPPQSFVLKPGTTVPRKPNGDFGYPMWAISLYKGRHVVVFNCEPKVLDKFQFCNIKLCGFPGEQMFLRSTPKIDYTTEPDRDNCAKAIDLFNITGCFDNGF